MLKQLIELLGADYDQWRCLTSVAIKLDLRSASLGQSMRSKESKSPAVQLIARLWVYVFVGAFLSVMVARNKDVFFTGTILVTYTMVMVAMLVLIDFGAVVISPDDFTILGYQPVSSQTYFISRLTNVLIYSTLLSLSLGVLPVLVFFFTLGFNPLIGLAALLAILLGSVAIALFLVFIYAAILRVIHPNKLRRAVGYLQLSMSFFLAGSYILLPRIIDYSGMGAFTLEKHLWLFSIPSTWFASYLDLARGHWRLSEIVPALLSLVALGWLLVKAKGKLALDYADRLSSAMSVNESVPKTSKSASHRSWFFRRNESRAVSLLVRKQFKYDQKFRLAVLGILPLSAVYLYMGLRNGPLADPFVTQSMGSDAWFIYFAALLFPTMLNTALANSDAYQASWIYYAAPADRGRLVLASKAFVFVYFEIPYLALLFVVFLFFWSNPLHVAVHLGVLTLLSYLFMQCAVMFNPVLPFSRQPRKAQRSASLILLMVLVPIAGIAFLFIFPVLLYPHPLILACALIGLVILSYSLEIVLKRRVQRRTEFIEYQG